MNPLAVALEGGQTASLLLVFLRCTGFVVTAPIFGHRAVPRPVKAGLIAMLALALVGGASAAPGAVPLLMAAPIELLIGITMGFALGLAFSTVETAARLLSLQMGLSLGAVFDPVSGEASTPFDPLFAVVAGLLFLALNLHLAIVGILADSFRALPIGGAWPTDLFGTVARLIALALELAARVAMPLALVLLLVELSVALISRAIPQVNVFFLGLPLKILVGIALVAIALPSIVAGMTGIFRFLLDGVAAAVVAGGSGIAGASPLPSVTP
jgi:flagellar biosynthesis protein FliR